MTNLTFVAAFIVAMSGAAASRSSDNNPVHTLRLKQRSRPIKEEHQQRLVHLHSNALDLKLAQGFGSEMVETYDSPDFESEAYYKYPLTLDYVVELAFSNGTDGEMVQYPVIVDTGSSNLAVAVSACTSCETGATTLDLGWYYPELCIDVTYGSGSWGGMMTDKIRVGFVDGDSMLTDSVYVGGITSASSFFMGGFNGILGLAYSALSESYSSSCTSASASSSTASPNRNGGGHQTTRNSNTQTATRQTHQVHQSRREETHGRTTMHGRPLEQLTGMQTDPSNSESTTTTMTSTPLLDSFYDDGLVSNQVFSILFCGDDASMAIGGYDTSQVKEGDSITFIDTQKTYGMLYGYFLVEALSVSVADVSVSTDTSDLNSIGGVLVDSGTTLIYLPTSVTTSVQTEVMANVEGLSEHFFEWSECVSEGDLATFPEITIALNGYDFKLSGSQYLLWYGGCYYWGLSSSSIPIIGNVALQDKVVVFDKANNQIGFAEGECSVLGGDSYEDDPTVSSKIGAPALLAADAIVSSSSISMVLAAVALVTLGTVFLISRLRSTYKPIPEEQV